MTYGWVRATASKSDPMNQIFLHYSYLQVLDFLTTLAFMANGVREGNPFVRLALTLIPNPLAGLLAIKLLALVLGIYCWRFGRQRLLSRINVLFAVLVAWNLVALILGTVGAATGHAG
jgi:F0F1-type ATP synthase membrane subunit a